MIPEVPIEFRPLARIEEMADMFSSESSPCLNNAIWYISLSLEPSKPPTTYMVFWTIMDL